MKRLFVGGTGRSGTTTLAKFIGSHPDMVVIPIELRLHVSPRGLVPYARGEIGRDKLVRFLSGKGFDRERQGTQRGASRLTTRVAYESLLSRLEADTDRPRVAAGTFLSGLLDGYAHSEGVSGWVEHTPENIRFADTLASAVPDSKFINIVRDGRDVAVSMVLRPWGDRDPLVNLERWADLVRLGHRALSELPPERRLTVSFEDVVLHRRGESFERVLGFCELDEVESVRRHFERNVSIDRAHIGRWRQELAGPAADAFDARHAEIAEELRAEGVDGLHG